jgi:hypothetical protein
MNVTVAKNKFEKDFESCIGNIKTSLVNDDGQWDILGTITRSGLVYPGPHDTKVISKNLESQVFLY